MTEDFREATSDQHLEQDATDAQRHIIQSPERQVALNRLIQGVIRSHHLGHPQREAWAPSLYVDLYNEALQRTLLTICQKIDHYNPAHPVMAWVNFTLNNQFINVVNDYKKAGITYMPKDHRNLITVLPSLEDLDRYIPASETQSEYQLLQQFLEEDPEGLLKTERLRERPDVTFQSLALAKFVEDQTWSDIADRLGISVQTLCSFFNRRLKKLMPYFHKHLQF